MESVSLGSLFAPDERRVIHPGSVVPYVLIGSDGSLKNKILTAESFETYSNWSVSHMRSELRWSPSDPPELIRTHSPSPWRG